MSFDAVKQAICAVYNLSIDVDFKELKEDKRMDAVSGLPELIQLLSDEHSAPKMVMQQLENVIVHIKLLDEDERSDTEKLLLQKIQHDVFEPMNHSSAAEEEGASFGNRLR